MPSFVVWDVRTREIVVSRIPPSGSALRPTIENLLPDRSEDWPYLRAEWIKPSLTTNEARRALRVVENQVVPKPTARLSLMDGSTASEAVLVLALDGMLDGENISGLRAVLEAYEMSAVELTIDPGETVLEFEVPGRYRLTLVDERVSQPVMPLELIIPEVAER